MPLKSHMPIRLAQVPDGWQVLDGENMNPDRSPSAAVKDSLRLERSDKLQDSAASPNINAPVTPSESSNNAQAIVDSFKRLVESCANTAPVGGSVAYVWYHYAGGQYSVTHIYAHDGRFVTMRITNGAYVGFTAFEFSSAIHINYTQSAFGPTQFTPPT